MTSLLRLVVSSSSSSLPASTLWRAAAAVLAVSGFIVLRACGFEFSVVARYLGYFALCVALPGAVTLYAIKRGPISISHFLALAVPTGFAVEIYTYLGLSALEAKWAYAWVPLVWIAIALGIRARRRVWPLRVRLSGHHAGLWLCLCAAFFGAVLMAASQMFAESPLADGLPTRAIFHDWVYLVSRAAVIKNNWPLDDPSLSGTKLQYHYFMMVHAAAVSRTTGVEITAVMLRLLYVPLGAALVAQAYVLGRAVSRTPWGGVGAAFLLVVVSEASFAPSYGQPMFLGLFSRWLFVSPTFFFGMIFCGALLIAINQCARVARCTARHTIWLLLLGTAGTGAKGTVLPVLICALGIWTAWLWWRERRLPMRLVVFGVCLTAAFFVVYIPTMSAWRTGDAAWRPFHVFQLASFWKQNFPAWQQALAAWLPVSVAIPLASVACASVVFAGTFGVRLLAIPYLIWVDRKRRDTFLVGWLGAFFVASAAMGVLLELNSYGELYVLLMIRLPAAVLTAAFLVALSRRVAIAWNETRPLQWPARLTWLAAVGGFQFRPVWVRRVVASGAMIFLGGVLTIQTALWCTRNGTGFREWLRQTPGDAKPEPSMRELREALLWVRRHIEPNAVLVPNAFTRENTKKDHWGALDGTLLGVHFYYSALSERRLWFEGPHYGMDGLRMTLRASIASNFFYRGRPLPPETVSADPAYALIDRSLADGATVPLPVANRVFMNSRIEIYRLTDVSRAQSTLEGEKVADRSQP